MMNRAIRRALAFANRKRGQPQTPQAAAPVPVRPVQHPIPRQKDMPVDPTRSKSSQERKRFQDGGQIKDALDLAQRKLTNKAPYGVIDMGDKIILGAPHGQPIELSDELKRRVQEVAGKHGAWYEGDAKDTEAHKNLISNPKAYRGSWDDSVAQSVKGYPVEYLAPLFSNVEVNKQHEMFENPQQTIFDSLLANQHKARYFKDRDYDRDTLASFLKQGSEEDADLMRMAASPATKENLQKFFSTGEKLMWPDNWQEYPNKLGQIAKRFEESRNKFLRDAGPGVYIAGAGHIPELKNTYKDLNVIGGERAGYADGGSIMFEKEEQPRKNIPLRPYEQRFNPKSGKLDAAGRKDIGFYGPIKNPMTDHEITEYSSDRDFQYPTVYEGMSDKDRAAIMMAERLGRNAPKGALADVDDRAYAQAKKRKAQGRSPFYEPGKDPYPKWSPEQHWDEPYGMPKDESLYYADGGTIEDPPKKEYAPFNVLPFREDETGIHFDKNAGLLGPITRGLKIARQAAPTWMGGEGHYDPNNPEDFKATQDLAGLAFGSGTAFNKAPRGAIGSFAGPRAEGVNLDTYREAQKAFREANFMDPQTERSMAARYGWHPYGRDPKTGDLRLFTELSDAPATFTPNFGTQKYIQSQKEKAARIFDEEFSGLDVSSKTRKAMIDDLVAKSVLNKGVSGPLGDFYNNPAVFSAYPGMENLRFQILPQRSLSSPSTRAEYVHSKANLSEPRINISKQEAKSATGRTSVGHEVQHRVQHIEDTLGPISDFEGSRIPNPAVQVYEEALATNPKLQQMVALENSPEIARIKDIFRDQFAKRRGEILRSRDGVTDIDANKAALAEEISTGLQHHFPEYARLRTLEKELREQGIPTAKPSEYLTDTEAYLTSQDEAQARATEHRHDWDVLKRQMNYPKDTLPWDSKSTGRLGFIPFNRLHNFAHGGTVDGHNPMSKDNLNKALDVALSATHPKRLHHTLARTGYAEGGVPDIQGPAELAGETPYTHGKTLASQFDVAKVQPYKAAKIAPGPVDVKLPKKSMVRAPRADIGKMRMHKPKMKKFKGLQFAKGGAAIEDALNLASRTMADMAKGIGRKDGLHGASMQQGATSTIVKEKLPGKKSEVVYEHHAKTPVERQAFASGGTPSAQELTNNFIAAAYEGIIGKPIDSASADYFAKQLNSGALSKNGFLNILAQTPEGINYANTKTLDQTYQILMGRSPTQQEQNIYLPKMATGSLSLDQLQKSVAQDPEAVNYVNNNLVKDTFTALTGKVPAQSVVDDYTSQLAAGTLDSDKLFEKINALPEAQQYQHPGTQPSPPTEGAPQEARKVTDVIGIRPGVTTVKYSDGSIEQRSGDFGWRQYNPGNIKYSADPDWWGHKFGGMKGGVATDGGNFAVFPSLEVGNEARGYLLFDSPGYKDLTLKEAMYKYAPPKTNPHIDEYIDGMAKAAGVSINTRMRDFTPEQRQAAMKSQIESEGNRPGEIKVIRPAETTPGGKTPEGGSPVTPIAPKDQSSAIDTIYNKSYGRNASDAEKSYLNNAIAKGNLTLDNLAAYLPTTAEAKQYANTSLDKIYNQNYGRNASDAEKAYLNKAIGEGTLTRENLAAYLPTTQEAKDFAAKSAKSAQTPTPSVTSLANLPKNSTVFIQGNPYYITTPEEAKIMKANGTLPKNVMYTSGLQSLGMNNLIATGSNDFGGTHYVAYTPQTAAQYGLTYSANPTTAPSQTIFAPSAQVGQQPNLGQQLAGSGAGGNVGSGAAGTIGGGATSPTYTGTTPTYSGGSAPTGYTYTPVSAQDLTSGSSANYYPPSSGSNYTSGSLPIGTGTGITTKAFEPILPSSSYTYNGPNISGGMPTGTRVAYYEGAPSTTYSSPGSGNWGGGGTATGSSTYYGTGGVGSGGGGYSSGGSGTWGGSTGGSGLGVITIERNAGGRIGASKEALRIADHYANGGGAWTRKEGKNPKGGLNAKGRASLRAQGHDIRPPAPHPKTEKDAARRKSFCARMSGMPGPMKDDNGKPTRKALSLRAWNCRADGGMIDDALRLARSKVKE